MLNVGTLIRCKNYFLATGSECFEPGKVQALAGSKEPLVKTPFIPSS